MARLEQYSKIKIRLIALHDADSGSKKSTWGSNRANAALKGSCGVPPYSGRAIYVIVNCGSWPIPISQIRTLPIAGC